MYINEAKWFAKLNYHEIYYKFVAMYSHVNNASVKCLVHC